MIMVSRCLCGEKCKYNGGDNKNEQVIAYCKDKELLKICPEVMGGLPTPRIPAEIVGGNAADVLKGKAKVMNQQGEDVTEHFISGALQVAELVKRNEVSLAILKAQSPSCGLGKVYDGTFTGKLIEGNGVLAELLLQMGIEVVSEKILNKVNNL